MGAGEDQFIVNIQLSFTPTAASGPGGAQCWELSVASWQASLSSVGYHTTNMANINIHTGGTGSIVLSPHNNRLHLISHLY